MNEGNSYFAVAYYLSVPIPPPVGPPPSRRQGEFFWQREHKETRTVWLIVATVLVIGLSLGILFFGDPKGDRQSRICKAHLREHSQRIR